jgi:hypothetical protein
MKVEKETLVAGELRIGFLKKIPLSGLLNNQLDYTLSSFVLVTKQQITSVLMKYF